MIDSKFFIVRIEPIYIEVERPPLMTEKEWTQYSRDVAHERFADMMRDGDLASDIIRKVRYELSTG